jgi:hypothetical protein
MEFFLSYSTMPCQGGLVENGVKNIEVDRIGRIVLGVKEQSDTPSVPRIQSKIESSLGLVPSCAEGPRVSLVSSVSINFG